MENLEIVRSVDENLSYVSTTCGVGFVLTTIGEKLFEVAETHPDKVAYIFHKNNGLKLTFSDVKDRAVRLAQNFVHIGLKKGDRIATLLPNTHELLICYFAAALNGLIVVPLDVSYDDLEYMIQKTDPSAIVVFNEGEFESIVSQLFPDINSSEKGNYVNEKFPSLRNLVFLKDLNENSKNVWTWSELADSLLNKGPAYELPSIDPEDEFVIIFTSGTTGSPKGIVNNHFKFVNSLNISSKLTPSQFESRICITFLLNHSAALTSILSVLFNPTTTVVFGSYILNIVDLLDSIQTYKCNIISGLPKIINNILNHPKRKDYDLSSLFCIVSAGQNVTSELIELVRKELANAKIMLVAYGSTETNNAFTNMINLDSFNPDSYQTCVGRPGAHVEAKIVNPETGKFQPFGEEGELYFRSYSQTRGYWNDEEKTNLAFDKDGWYNTGDFLSMDADGLFYFKSRRKELITVKGSSLRDRTDVLPIEIECCLLKHPNVQEAVAFGVSINVYEQEICAWVKLKTGQVLTTVEELIKFCQYDCRLDIYKLPRFIKIVNDFPTTTMGKYLRRAMQDAYKLELKL